MHPLLSQLALFGPGSGQQSIRNWIGYFLEKQANLVHQIFGVCKSEEIYLYVGFVGGYDAHYKKKYEITHLQKFDYPARGMFNAILLKSERKRIKEKGGTTSLNASLYR